LELSTQKEQRKCNGISLHFLSEFAVNLYINEVRFSVLSFV